MTRHALFVIGSLALAGWVGTSIPQNVWSETHQERAPLFTGLQLTSYDCAQRRWVMSAARGYASRKRLGFLQTALVPTVELENVMIERVRDDGTIETQRLAQAVIDWSSKTVSTLTGSLRLHIATPLQPFQPGGHEALQAFCQG